MAQSARVVVGAGTEPDLAAGGGWPCGRRRNYNRPYHNSLTAIKYLHNDSTLPATYVATVSSRQ